MTAAAGLCSTPLVQAFACTCAAMYAQGWDERNGGNLSLLLSAREAALFPQTPRRIIPTGFTAMGLAGRTLLVTATGSYFRNTAAAPADNLGAARIGADGKTAELLWGFGDTGRPTSELAAHLMSHETMLARDAENRVVLHCHPSNLLAMTFVHPLDEAAFTRSLWRSVTECMMVFPDGVGVLPWMMCGTPEIGAATAEKMRQFRLVVWAQHGVYAAGRSLDEAFGLVETVEKAAQIYMLTSGRPILNTITDENLKTIAKTLSLSYREDFFK